MSLTMNRWIGKVAIVTGASSGIGAAIAARLVKEGLKVVGLARRKARLDSLAKTLTSEKGKFYPVTADVTKEEDIINAFKWTAENVGVVHTLINNAGTYREKPYMEVSAEDAKAVFDVNVMAIIFASREALKLFKQHDINGHIININSQAGHTVLDVPCLGIYTASKYAVTALTKSLYQEAKALQLGTKVTSISPGFIETELNTSTAIGSSYKASPLYAALKVEDIADGVVYVLSTPPHCQIDELMLNPNYIKKK